MCLCICSLILFLRCLAEFRKKNVEKKAAVSKGKGDEQRKKRKLEVESSDKGEASINDESPDKAEDSDKSEGEEDDE